MCDVALDFILGRCERGQRAQVAEFVLNQHKSYERVHAIEIPVMEDAVASMRKTLIDGGKFTACFNTLSGAQVMHAALRAMCVRDGVDPEMVQLWTSKHGVPITNIKQQWDACCPFYSPIIVTGRDYVPDVPTATYCFVSGTGTLSPEEVVQQLARNRNIKTLYFHLERVAPAIRSFKTEADVEACMRRERASLRVVSLFREVCERNQGRDGAVLGDNDYTRLLCKVELRRHLMQCNFRQHLLRILTDKGFIVTEAACASRGFDTAQAEALKEDIDERDDLLTEAFIAGLPARAAAGGAAPLGRPDSALEIGAMSRARALGLPLEDPQIIRRFKDEVFDNDGAFQQHENTRRLLLSQAASKDIYNKHYHGDKSLDAPKAGVTQAAIVQDIFKECVDGHRSLWELQLSVGRDDHEAPVPPVLLDHWQTLHRLRQKAPRTRGKLIKSLVTLSKKLFGDSFCEGEQLREQVQGRRRNRTVYRVCTSWRDHHVELFKYSAHLQAGQLDSVLAARLGLPQ